jgi:RNA polymerase sigma factor (sigma-70 family)
VASDTAEMFAAERRRLFGLAYRLLGSAADAEDVVQSAFEQWIAADRAAVKVPEAWLTTVVTNLCLNQLGSARSRRERYPGTWLPEPVVTSNGALGPLETAEQRDSVSFALLVLLERLTAAERGVFVLREAFGYRYADVAQILGRPEATCRQLHRRAIQRLGAPRRFRPESGQWRRLVERFMAAAAEGDVAGLERLLAEDVVYWADGAGSGLSVARKPVAGRQRVARLFGTVLPRYLADPRYALGAEMSVAEVNGQPAALAWISGGLIAVFIPETDGTEMTALRIVTSPAKLRFAARQLAGAETGCHETGPRIVKRGHAGTI